MRYRGIWSSRIELGLFIVSLLYTAFLTVNAPDPRYTIGMVTVVMLLLGQVNLTIALIAGAITALISRSLSFGIVTLLGTFYGLTAGVTIAIAVHYAILSRLANFPVLFWAGVIVLLLLWLIAGICGGLDWFLWYSRRQK